MKRNDASLTIRVPSELIARVRALGAARGHGTSTAARQILEIGIEVENRRRLSDLKVNALVSPQVRESWDT